MPTKAELRNVVRTLRSWREVFRRLGFKLRYERGVGPTGGERGVSCCRFGFDPSEREPGKFDMYAIHCYRGGFDYPPEIDADPTDDPPLDLPQALWRLMELECEGLAGDVLADMSLEQHLKENRNE